jgi:glycosyltransferase involved in cell wall biosynthesis
VWCGFASFGWSFDFAQDDGRDGAHVTLTVARRSTATTEADGCPDLPPSAPVSLIPLTLKKAFDAGSRVYLEPSMKIALLHYTFWPEVGGVEHLMRDQANMLCRAGHEVTVITGVGRDTGEDYQVVVLPELAPDHKLNAAVRTLLQSGQSDQNLNKYRALLVKAVGKALGGFDVTIVHNVFTMHHNLGLTLALRDLAPKHRMIAWTHDLVANDSDYVLPNPTKSPWSLMRSSAPDVLYVAVSEQRGDELAEYLQPSVQPVVVPNVVDVVRLFGLTPEIRASLASLDLAGRDLVLLLPARIMVRKNIEFALAITQRLCEMDLNPLLMITGGLGGVNEASQSYSDFLHKSLPETIAGNVVFVNDFFEVQDDTLRDLYLLTDCLLFPSKHEGFGLPLIEAALHRMPIWCSKVPAFWAVEGEGCYLLEDLDQIPDALDWLQEQPTFRNHRLCRKMFDPAVIYEEYYEPLLATIPRTKLL